VRRAIGIALAAVALTALTPAGAQARDRFDTRVLARVPFPGYPAQAYVHPGGRVYEGTYLNSSAGSTPSRVFEFDGQDGTLLRSWTVPGQNLGGQQAVQVTTSDAQGDLVVLDNDPARVLKLDRDSGDFRVYSTFADVEGGSPPRPNYGAWGPDGSLYVTDYGQGLIWRVPAGGGPAVVWLRDGRLEGSAGFGTTGIALAADRRTLLIAQGTSAVGVGELNPTTGKIYSVPIDPAGRPGRITRLWESAPGDVPDGFAIAASGRLYVPMVGLSAQLAVVAPDGREIERFPRAAGSGDNGSPVPFDSPSSARFLGTRLIVANQSALAGTPANQALLDVEAGETGLPELIPGRDAAAPRLTRVSVAPKRFAAIRRGGKPRRARKGRPARGARLRLTASERVTLGVRVERRVRGRWRRVQSFERTLAAGRRSVRFGARVKSGRRTRALPAGRYRFSMQAADAAGNRSPRIFRSFRLVPGSKPVARGNRQP
jgi:sugar lactone lactonase YvrE